MELPRRSKETVQENLCRMVGRRFAGHRSYDDLERVTLGVYRLRPSLGLPLVAMTSLT